MLFNAVTSILLIKGMNSIWYEIFVICKYTPSERQIGSCPFLLLRFYSHYCMSCVVHVYMRNCVVRFLQCYFDNLLGGQNIPVCSIP
jgi:hypothetical protein